MARQTKEVTLKDRDTTYVFAVREMPATKLEAWIMRALLVLSRSGFNGLPEGANLQNAVQTLLASESGLMALIAGLDYEEAKPLLDEMLECCYRKIGGVEERCTLETVEGYIEDVKTLFILRMEAIKLNLGFLRAEVESISDSRRKPDTSTQ